ncbi:MAG: GDP-mannose 4,6-dehydratase, partial [Nitrososphaeraceae archaeon]
MEDIKIDLNFLKNNNETKRVKILITGVAGFIGSSLLEFFLKEGFKVVGIDSFITGSKKNIDDVICKSSEYNNKFTFSF